MVITGPTGAGKTYLARALGNATCRNGYSVRYFQLSRLLEKLKLARADRSYPKLLDKIAKYKLLILDDWLRRPGEKISIFLISKCFRRLQYSRLG